MRHYTKYGALAALAAAAALTGGSPAQAAGKHRDLPQFSRIVTDGAFAVTIAAGKPQSLHLQSDPDYLDRTETSVEDGVLSVRTTGQGTIQADIRIAITIPDFQGLTILGASEARITDVADGPVNLSIQGAGDITITGSCTAPQMSIAGAGAIYAQDLTRPDVTVAISGSGEVETHAEQSLTATIGGSGDIFVFGQPAILNQTITGAGEIHLD